jgi:uncharacterized protein YqeY
MKEAMKAKNAAALNVLRALKSAIKYAAIEKHGADGNLDDTEAVAVVRKQIKQRQDSIESYEKAERPELVAKEQAEIAVLEDFLPAGMSGAEIAALVEACVAEVGATSKKEMGQVMKLVQERAAGRADGKALSQEVMKRLG